jgi:dTDP-4-dehydrorhamnose reductase
VTDKARFRILLLGKVGQLGWELHRCLQPLGDVQCIDYPELDLGHPENLRPVVRASHADLIVNATAYTAVDQAESEPGPARAINGVAPGVLAEEALRAGVPIIHYSTDYVFDGMTSRPYTEDDLPHPINTYGRTKLEGEQAIQAIGGTYLILRTSWVYSLRRKSFVTQVLDWARTQNAMRVVADQVGSPTWCRSLAQVTALVVAMGLKDITGWIHERAGIYHLAGQGSASRLEWAVEILRLDPAAKEQIVQEVSRARSDDFPAAARRPAFSALDCGRFRSAFGIELPDWRQALRLAMEP